MKEGLGHLTRMKIPQVGQTLFGHSAIRAMRTRHFASPGCPGFALFGEEFRSNFLGTQSEVSALFYYNPTSMFRLLLLPGLLAVFLQSFSPIKRGFAKLPHNSKLLDK